MPSLPDQRGHFGEFGGRYVAETLMPALLELERAYARCAAIARFRRELTRPACASTPAGRRRSTSRARLTERLGGARIYLKREDLCHTGAHKINNTLGQVLLARRMGKTRHHRRDRRRPARRRDGDGRGALRPALRGLHGREDVQRQALNVFRMKLLGATVHRRRVGQRDAEGRDERGAARLGHQRARHVLHHRLGGRPASVSDDGARLPVGDRPRGATPDRAHAAGRLPDVLVACVGGGSNAMGLFHPFLDERRVRDDRRRGGRATGSTTGAHAASLTAGQVGVLHGNKTYLLQDELGQIRSAHSISAGLDYPGVGPEHGYLRDSGRATYVAVTDDEAVDGAAAARRARGHHPGARERARGRARDPARADAATPSDHGRQPLGPRRQGHGDGGELPGSAAWPAEGTS